VPERLVTQRAGIFWRVGMPRGDYRRVWRFVDDAMNRRLDCCVSVCDELLSASGSSRWRTVCVSSVTRSNSSMDWRVLFGPNAARASGFCRTMEHKTGREHALTWLTRRERAEEWWGGAEV
jgi:hypothetical protein